MRGEFKHGTHTAYQRGCRCLPCIRAANARSWALRRECEWDAPIEAFMRCNETVTLDGMTLTQEVLLAALKRHEKMIKTDILARLREKRMEGAL